MRHATNWVAVGMAAVLTYSPGFAGVMSARADDGKFSRQEIGISKTTGFVPSGGGARFSGVFAQRTNEPVVMEAELATGLSFAEGNGIGMDPTASGGGYVTRIENGAWDFVLKTSGRYTMWERGAFPWTGYWNHMETIDGASREFVTDVAFTTNAVTWKWIKGRTFDLKAGKHTFTLNYLGGSRLDLLVLSPDGEKEPDLATLNASYSGPAAGEIWTVPVKPFDVARWNSAHLEVQLNGGSALYEASFDGGSTWKPIPANDDLSKIPVLGQGQDSVMFHVKLEAADATCPPTFGGAWLDYQPGPANIKIVENSRLRMEMDSTGVKSLFDKKIGQFVARARQNHGSLLKLSCKKPGNANLELCDLNSAKLDGFQVTHPAPDVTLMTICHSLGNGMRTTTTALLKPDGQIEWNLSVDNPTQLEIFEVMFPLLSGCRIGEDGKDDWLFIPKCWGQLIQNPETLHSSVFWAPVMRWAMLWDKSAGLYVSLDNPKLDDYGIFYGCAAGTSDFTLAPIIRTLGKPGSPWKSDVYRFAVTGSDWHEGADLYRATVVKALKPCDVAPHVKWLLDVWTHQNGDLFPNSGWDTIRQSFESQEFFGTHMSANRQMLDGADVCWNGYFPYPAPAWGSATEFAQQLEALRSKGGFYMPYLNYHLFTGRNLNESRIFTYPKSRLPKDVPVPDEAWYAKAAARGMDGSTTISKEFFSINADYMAIASPVWSNWVAYWTRQYFKWGVDGMYYDQFNTSYVGGWLYQDYPNSYGSWANAAMDCFGKIKDAARKNDPYCAFIGEVCNDANGQRLDLHMVSGVFNRLEFYRYTVPDHLLLDGSWNGGLYNSGWERERFIWQVGARFQEMADRVPNDPDRKWVTSILRLRRAVKSLLYDADFRDTAGLVLKDSAGKVIETVEPEAGEDRFRPAPIRGLSARWFLFKNDGQSGAIVNCMNAFATGDAKKPSFAPRADALVCLSTKDIGPISSAWAWLLDGRVVPVDGKQAGDTYTFKIPSSELSSVVLSHSLRPIVAWSFDNVTTRGATRQFKLKITNVNAAPLKGRVVLEPPKGWDVPVPLVLELLESGKSVELSVPVTVPKEAELGRHDIWCHVKTDAGDFAAYHFAVVNPPVLVEFRGNPGSYHLWFRNLTETPASANVTLSAPAPLMATCAGQIEIPPTNTVMLPVKVLGQSQLREISEMSAEVSMGQTTKRLVRAVMPTVPNGDFEMDSAKDMKPDWWMCRNSSRDGFSYEKMNLSSEAPHGGKYCLRLDPPSKEQQLVYAFPESNSLKAGAKYRVSCWIRSKAKEGVYVGLGETFKLGDGKTSEAWQEFSVEQTLYPGAKWMLINKSGEPAFFDDFKIEEL